MKIIHGSKFNENYLKNNREIRFYRFARRRRFCIDRGRFNRFDYLPKGKKEFEHRSWKVLHRSDFNIHWWNSWRYVKDEIRSMRGVFFFSRSLSFDAYKGDFILPCRLWQRYRRSSFTLIRCHWSISFFFNKSYVVWSNLLWSSHEQRLARCQISILILVVFFLVRIFFHYIQSLSLAIMSKTSKDMDLSSIITQVSKDDDANRALPLTNPVLTNGNATTKSMWFLTRK